MSVQERLEAGPLRLRIAGELPPGLDARIRAAQGDPTRERDAAREYAREAERRAEDVRIVEPPPPPTSEELRAQLAASEEKARQWAALVAKRKAAKRNEAYRASHAERAAKAEAAGIGGWGRN